MDPVTLILAALTAGAAASAKDTASVAVKDAYDGLKGLIQRKLANKPAAQMALAEYEKKPDIWRAPLEEEIKEIRINQDKEIVAAAQKVMSMVRPQQAAMGKYNVQITGNVQGFAQGDNQQVTMNFGNEVKDK